jgi:hypothetical protein
MDRAHLIVVEDKQMRMSCRAAPIVFALGLITWANAASAQSATPKQDGPPAVADHTERESVRPLRVGVIGGVGFPRPLAIEALTLLGESVALGAEYGVLPDLTVDGVHTSLWSLAGDVRFFPFRHGFFVGVRAGRQHVGADTAVTVAPYGSANESLSLDSWFINPRIGFLWTSAAGLALGMEVGVQVPLVADTTSSLPLALVPGAQRTADALGSSILPTVDLLRVGVVF